MSDTMIKMSDTMIITIWVCTMIFILIIITIFGVLYGVSHMKALKALGYDKPWMVWIPFANYWALAEVVLDGEENINLLGSFSVSATVFKLWWLIAYGVSFVPVVGSLLNLVLHVVCLGTCYIKMYARLDGRDEGEMQALGYVSGFFPIVAIVKFLIGRYGD